MAIVYLVRGSVNMAGAGWEGGTGFAAAATLIVDWGTQHINQNMDQSAAAAGTYLRFERGFKGTVGTPDNPLMCRMSDGAAARKASDTTDGYVYWSSEGELNLKAAAATGIDNFIGDAGHVNLLGNTFAYLDISGACSLNVNSSTTVTEAWLSGGTSFWDEQASGTTPTLIEIWGGVHTFKRPAYAAAPSIIRIHGGKFIYDTNDTNASDQIDLHGGIFEHVSGNITAMNQYGGFHDYRRMRRASTIATLYRRPDTKVDGIRTLGLLTITNDRTYAFPR